MEKQAQCPARPLVDFMLPENGQDFDFWVRKWVDEKRGPNGPGRIPLSEAH